MFLKHLRAKLIVPSATLICASTLFGGMQANAACILQPALAGENLAYRYAAANINSLLNADDATVRLTALGGSLIKAGEDPSAVPVNLAEILTSLELAARSFECAASAIRTQKQFPTDRSNEFAQKQSKLARETANAAGVAYLQLAKDTRSIAALVSSATVDDYMKQSSFSVADFTAKLSKFSANIKYNKSHLYVFSSVAINGLIDPKSDQHGYQSRLQITRNERDDLIRMIDTAFGERARSPTDRDLPEIDATVTMLRTWLTTSGHTPRISIEDREPMSQETTHPRNKPETNFSLLALGFIILFFIGRAIYKHPSSAFLMGRTIHNVLPKRCLHCNTRTRNNNRICDACKTRMDYEKAKAQEREQQEREARDREKKREEASADEKHKRDEDARRGESTRNEAGTHSTGGEGFNPYEVLQVNRSASKEEIKKAYLKAIKQYHPDKVSHLGKEFQEMAEKKTRVINRAYEILTSF